MLRSVNAPELGGLLGFDHRGPDTAVYPATPVTHWSHFTPDALTFGFWVWPGNAGRMLLLLTLRELRESWGTWAVVTSSQSESDRAQPRAPWSSVCGAV